MNRLLIGNADKTEQLLKTSGAFLLIDDGEICDAFLETFPTARDFDPHKHHFNPLEGMDYKKARDFADLVYGVSPQGANTLTVRNGKRALVKLLLEQPTGLDALPTPKTPAEEEAVGMIQDLLVSPILKGVLCGHTNIKFSPNRKFVARIDRAELGDFDALVLGNLLIGQFQGQVILPDGGFYLREFHTSLIRQNRLIAGLNSFAEVSKTLEQALVGIKDKVIYRTSPQDAEKLIVYTRHVEPNILVRQTGLEYTPSE